ncbi:MAG: hypothetical protein KA385_12785, partial [Vicinamibacteria bacterium]|nr:hypothetical protein [Vicinamibacteria bacterium]
HPVIAAARAGSLGCLELLIDRGARPRAREVKLALEQAGGPDEERITARLAGLQAVAGERKSPRGSAAKGARTAKR